MVKKIIEEIYCDDCGKKQHPFHGISIPRLYLGYHLCEFCLGERLKFSFHDNPIGSTKCIDCEGTGQYKEWIGIGTDYTYKKCNRCRGEGRIMLS